MKPTAENSQAFDPRNNDLNKLAIEGQLADAKANNELLNISGLGYDTQNYPVKSELAIAKSKYLFTSILSDYEY